jgi:hypothetical protein
MLSLGQQIVISGEPVAAITPTPVPTEAQPITLTLVPDESQSEEATVMPESGAASVCVLAFNDQNGDTIYQAESEALVPNVTLSLVGTNGPGGTYTTDGLNEPYCFENLQPGNYVLRQSPPEGYQISGPGEQGILLNAGQVYAVQVGYSRNGQGSGGGSAITPENGGGAAVEPVDDEEQSTGENRSILSTIVRISGIVALLLAIAVGVLFVISRR